MVASDSKTQFDFAGLKLEPFVVAQQEGQFDLGLEMAEGSGLLVGTFKYNSDLFNAATIVRMTGHLQTLLERIVANPEQRICELCMMTTTERDQLLEDWNDTKREYSAGVTYPKLFEAQAERTPNAVAIVFEGRQLSYRELNARANQLAHQLNNLSVVPGGAGGRLSGALHRNGHRLAGHPQGRRRLRAAGPGIPGIVCTT